MDGKRNLSFNNRKFKLFWIVLVLIAFLYVVLSMFFDNFFILGLRGALVVVIVVVIQHPYKYIIDGDKLLLKFYAKRAKVINITDIEEIDVGKHNCLPFIYKSADSEELMHERLFLNDIQIRFMQESFTRKNSNIKVLFE